MRILQEQREKRQITVVLITHEPDIAAYGTRIVAVRDGAILSDKPNTPRSALEEELQVPLMVANGN
jgi:putative ABC transport system ATP-binding protein